jgi:hypothetical protein
MQPQKKQRLKKSKIIFLSPQINKINNTPVLYSQKPVKEIKPEEVIVHLPHHCTQLLFLS